MDGAARRILVVEDDVALRRLLADVLREEFGAEVDAVEDGSAAVGALARGGYALVVLDVLMPIADGYAVLRWLASRRPDARVPAVVSTGAGEEACAQAMRLGAAACLAKPYQLDELLDAVRRLLGARGSGRHEGDARGDKARTGCRERVSASETGDR